MTVPIEIKIKIVLLMAKFDSTAVVTRKLQSELGQKTPGEDCLARTFQRFCEMGPVEDRLRSGRSPTITEVKVDEAHDVCATESRTRVRAEMCRTLLPILQDFEIQENIFFLDEASFHMNGFVDKHNIRYLCESNPHKTLGRVMISPKRRVWCALSKNQLIGPFFFGDDTVNAKNYLTMRQLFSVPAVKRLRKVRSIIFQQDEAPAHFARDVREFLDQNFPNRWIGRGGSIQWAPRSPDLTPLDFFLWSTVKNNVYGTPIENVTELERRILDEVHSIHKETLSDVFSNVLKRMNLCISIDGDHFDRLL